MFRSRVENILRTNHGFGKVRGTGGNDKEFLKGKLVTSVFSAVNDIEAGNRKSVGDGVSGNVGVVLPKRNTLRRGTGLTGSQRDYQAKEKKTSVRGTHDGA